MRRGAIIGYPLGIFLGVTASGCYTVYSINRDNPEWNRQQIEAQIKGVYDTKPLLGEVLYTIGTLGRKIGFEIVDK